MKRRQFIMLGLATGSALTLGISTMPLFTADSAQQRDSAVLVLDALLPALLHGALPADAVARQAALRRSRDAVLQFLPFLPQSQQQQLRQLFVLLETDLSRLALTGHWLSLHELPIPMRLQLLHTWRDSYLTVLQQAYAGLKELLFAAYYGQPQHWQPLSYQPPEFNPYV